MLHGLACSLELANIFATEYCLFMNKCNYQVIYLYQSMSQSFAYIMKLFTQESTEIL